MATGVPEKKLLRICIARDCNKQPQDSPADEEEKAKSRFYDVGTGLELRKVTISSELSCSRFSKVDTN